MVSMLSHRGLWERPEERNTLGAFTRSFEAGFGTEVDVRDHDRALVISHDPPSGPTLLLEEVLDSHRRIGPALPLALNVKSCGLAAALAELLARYGVASSFVFDMAVPDALDYANRGLAAFTRVSEYEEEPAFYALASGVWVDCFREDWIGDAAVSPHLAAGKSVALVSPELHRRPHEAVWKRWAAAAWAKHPRVYLCTDHPEAARRAFES
jgi:hypothetical protein